MSIAKWLLAKKLGGGSPFPPVIKRKTGNPIEFTDGADAPLVKCVSSITGSQDLHGYDKPWVGGAGVNKCDMSVVNPVSVGYIYGLTVTKDEATGTIRIQGIPTYDTTGDKYPRLFFYTGIYTSLLTCKIFLVSKSANVAFVRDWTYKNTDDSISIAFYVTDTNAVDITVKPLFYEGSTAPTDWTPYSNICPITAYTDGEIEVRGKNALDTSTVTIRGITFTQDSDGYVSASPNNSDPGAWRYSNSQYKTSLYPGSYSLIVEVKTVSANVNADAKIFDSDDNTILSLAPSVAFASLGIKRFDFTIENKLDIGVMFKQYDAVARFMVIKSTDSSTYESYTSTTHTTTYPSAIYRGSEDVVNGSVTSEWVTAKIKDFTWIYSSDNSAFLANITGKKVGFLNIISSAYNAVNKTLANLSSGEMRGSTNNNVVYIKDTRYTIATDFVTAMGEEYLAYEITTTTSSVTPTNLPIKSLSGYNHIESSTGEMVVDYITDAYQNFVDTVESALPNTRKGGVKAFDIFATLDNPSTEPDKDSDEDDKKVKEETKEDMR